MDFGGIAVFFILQLVNVIVSTMRSVLTIKGSKHTAVLVNTISYTFYAGVVKLMTGQTLPVVLVVTAITNIIGVYLAMFILSKMQKDKLWVFNATAKIDYAHFQGIAYAISSCDLPYIYNEVVKDKLYTFQIFAYTQDDSKKAIEILEKSGAKYYVTENRV